MISVGKTETPKIIREEKEEWPPQAAGGVLEAVGVDTSLLDIEENEATIQVTPKRFLGDQWGPINDKIREMVIKGASSSEIKQYACRLGMKTLRENALEKFVRGETSLEEVLRMTAEE